MVKSQVIVKVNNLSFAYRNDVQILKNINLAILAGDYWVITGENGSGKTTLLKLILGLLPLQKGSVKLFSTPLAAFKNWSQVAYVPQKVTSFDSNFPATVEEIVLMGRYGRIGLFKNPTPDDKKKVAWSLRQIQMEHFAKHQINALSGGQQQRVFIARALASEPKIVFLDEPTVGIDVATRDEFYELLRTMNQKLGLTIILVTHDIEHIAAEFARNACLGQITTYRYCSGKESYPARSARC